MNALIIRAAAIAAGAQFLASVAAGSITIPTVPIGNPGNAADPLTGNRYGGVSYAYSIGATEVTNAQYAAFLNAVASTDTNQLYLEAMGTSGFGGISRAGSAGSYTYTAIGGRESRPVNFVTFWSAARFANWLHNGQPSGPQGAGTTEGGVYTLTPGGISGNTVTRNGGWQWAIANENEWYKAAYYQPASLGGDSDGYWLYPTSSNIAPTASQVNFADSGIIDVRPVGSYAANFWGTFDMGGNAWEWNEAIISGVNRGVRGGSFGSSENQLRSTWREFIGTPDGIGANLGFRVVAVPGPSPMVLMMIGGIGAARRRRCSRARGA